MCCEEVGYRSAILATAWLLVIWRDVDLYHRIHFINETRDIDIQQYSVHL